MMRLEEIEGKIQEQKSIVMEATIRLEAWLEVLEAYSGGATMEPESEVPQTVMPKRRNLNLAQEIYAVLPTMSSPFTAHDVYLAVRERLEGKELDERQLKGRVHTVLHAVASGRTKHAPVSVKTVKGKKSTDTAGRKKVMKTYVLA